MKTTIKTLIAITAIAFTGSSAIAADSCSKASGSSCSVSKAKGRIVILNGKKVIVSDCKFTTGVRSVRMVKTR